MKTITVMSVFMLMASLAIMAQDNARIQVNQEKILSRMESALNVNDSSGVRNYAEAYRALKQADGNTEVASKATSETPEKAGLIPKWLKREPKTVRPQKPVIQLNSSEAKIYYKIRQDQLRWEKQFVAQQVLLNEDNDEVSGWHHLIALLTP